MRDWPSAYADLFGSAAYEEIFGRVCFYEAPNGTIVAIELQGVTNELGEPATGFCGFHVHDGPECSGNASDPLANAGTHMNPDYNPHPYHAGDLPVLLMNHGYAWMQVFTERFYPEEVLGRTVIIHAMPDDFRTQPSGDSGKKIACGIILPWEQGE